MDLGGKFCNSGWDVCLLWEMFGATGAIGKCMDLGGEILHSSWALGLLIEKCTGAGEKFCNTSKRIRLLKNLHVGGSNPRKPSKKKKKEGVRRESNAGPPVP